MQKEIFRISSFFVPTVGSCMLIDIVRTTGSSSFVLAYATVTGIIRTRGIFSLSVGMCLLEDNVRAISLSQLCYAVCGNSTYVKTRADIHGRTLAIRQKSLPNIGFILCYDFERPDAFFL